jgi:hypothetical protein
VPAGLGVLDDECVGAERGCLISLGDAADLRRRRSIVWLL